MKERIDLRETHNPSCLKCTPDNREKYMKNGICEKVLSVIDDLPVRCVGGWACKKIYYVSRYFSIFSVAMSEKWRSNLNYVEICCGPGRCISKEDGEEIDGTSLSIINHSAFNKLRKAVFIDSNLEVINTLNERIESLGKKDIATANLGDYNDAACMKKIFNELPRRGLTLAFIDPTHCDVPLSTIEAIKKYFKKVDLIINVSIGTDLKRNIRAAVMKPNFKNVRNKYNSFLGESDFFSEEKVLSYANQGNIAKLSELFLEEYKASLRKLGFEHFGTTPTIEHFYYLLFASKHSSGLDFWKKSVSIEANGQRTLF